MKTVLLIGAGRFGMQIARELTELGHQVMVVEKDEERINEIMPYVTEARIGNAMSLSFMQTLGVRNFDLCIVAISDDFQGSLESTSLLKELGAECVISRAETNVQEKFLLKVGADHILYPKREMAKWAATRYTCDNVLDYIQLDSKHSIFEVEVPENWIGRTVGTIDVRKKYGINILGVKRKGVTSFAVTPDTFLDEGTTLFVIGEYKALQKCFRL